LIREVVLKNRSCRRFDPSTPVPMTRLREWVDLARCTASAANQQPLKYILSSAPDRNAAIFDCLKWAAYLTDWDGPAPDERPTGYIIICGDRTVSTNYWCDHGIAAQTMLLAAVEAGFAGCMLAAINHPRLKHALTLGDHLDILLVLALGAPAETIILEDLAAHGDIRYWRDAAGVHHVPKRPLAEVILAAYPASGDHAADRKATTLLTSMGDH